MFYLAWLNTQHPLPPATFSPQEHRLRMTAWASDLQKTMAMISRCGMPRERLLEGHSRNRVLTKL